MPLQNRVSPYSTIEAVEDRGMFMGNRGRLHGADKRLVKTTWGWRFWIICSLEWKGVRRELMQPRSYTELFFLDEAVALAAGHRPCALCRRSAFRDYQAACSDGGLMRAPAMDAVLHEERVRGHWEGEYSVCAVSELPDGVFVEREGVDGPWLVWAGRYWGFGFGGYSGGGGVRGSERVRALTPGLSVRALREGYGVVVHPSVD